MLKLLKNCLVVLFLFLTASASAQSFVEYIAQNPLRSASGMFHYELSELKHTDPPQGYKPFYISHFGRHGSRYPINQSKQFFIVTLEELDNLSELSVLTPSGLALVEACHRLYDECEGNWEKLTSRGRTELRGIASRMIERYPEVFETDSIDVYSTSSARVIESRDNFLSVMNSLRVNSQIDGDSPTASQEVKGYDIPQSIGSLDNVQTYPTDMIQFRNSEELFDIFFLKGKAPKNGSHIVRKALHCLEYCATLEDYSEYDKVLKMFPVGEFVFNAANAFNGRASQLGFTSDNDHRKSDYRGVGIARKIVEDADRAIAQRNIAATLRFSHDYFIVPLACVIGVKGADVPAPACEAYKYFDSISISAMAANMQMIFFDNCHGEILVKLLWSEKEVLVNDLKAAEGVYYHWNNLRRHILDRCYELIPI